MWGWETAEAMLKDACFDSIERHVLPHDPMNIWFVARLSCAPNGLGNSMENAND
jgi:hypothetical protein